MVENQAEMPQQQQTPPPMESTQTTVQPPKRGKLPKWALYGIIATAAIAVAGIGVGAYYLLTKEDKEATPEVTDTDTTAEEEQDTNETDNNAENNEENESITTEKPDTIPLQELINTYCEKVDYNGGYTYFTELKNYPFTIDTHSITVVPGLYGESTCTTALEEFENKGSIEFDYTFTGESDKNAAFIHDKDSAEPGHGGAPFFGSYGTKIESGEGYEISVYLSRGDVYAGVPSDYFAYIRARKDLIFKGNYHIYINSDILVYSANANSLDFDQSFYDFLVATSDSSTPPIKVNHEEAVATFPDTFFSDLTNLGTKEKAAFDKAKTFLEAIEIKGN